MIYLFDDTPEKDRKKHVDLTSFNNIALYGTMSLSEFESMRMDLEQAECVLVHRSLRDADNPNRNDVYERILDITDRGDRIPLVVFSGEDTEEAVFDGDSFIRRFSKVCLYENLPHFLSVCSSTHSVDLTSLAYGEKMEAKLALEEGISLIKKVRLLLPDQTFDVQRVAGDELHSLIQRSSPALGCKYSDVIAEIRSGDLTAGEFTRRIKEILDSFNAYGKNVYRWGS